MPDDAPIPPAAAVPRSVRELVGLLNRSLFPGGKGIDEAALRELLGHPDFANSDPKSIRRILLKRHLDSLLAGNLKALLKREETLQEFLRPERPVTWQDAMKSVWEFVAENIKQILDPNRLVEKEEHDGKFRSLCRLALDWGIDPETYRRLLVASGLPDSRASEIKRVLGCRTARNAFVVKKNCTTWHQALQQARQLGLSEEEQRTHKLALLSRQLVRLVVRKMEKHCGTELTGEKFSISRISPGKFSLLYDKRVTFFLEPNPTH